MISEISWKFVDSFCPRIDTNKNTNQIRVNSRRFNDTKPLWIALNYVSLKDWIQPCQTYPKLHDGCELL